MNVARSLFTGRFVLWLLGDEESEEDEEFGNVHIIELHKGEEPLGIHLTHYTAPDNT